jgi:hypothetical protein
MGDDTAVAEIFVNYRKVDSRYGAAVVHQSLVRRFGARHVFIDHQSMNPGVRYPDGLRAGIAHARILLVLIGPNWLADDPLVPGKRLVDREDEWVRREIREALANHLEIIPVLLGGASLPAPGTLPKDIEELTMRQRAWVDDRSNRTWQSSRRPSWSGCRNSRSPRSSCRRMCDRRTLRRASGCDR